MRGVIDDTKLENIAAAIRERTGSETTYTPEEMPGGVAEVYDKAMSDSESAFWDIMQNFGQRTDYSYAFYQGDPDNPWNDETFKPKYDMHPTTLERAFRYTKITHRALLCGLF